MARAIKNINIKGAKDIDLRQTFECGQCFRWNEEADGSYTGVVGKSALNIRKSEEGLEIEALTIDERFEERESDEDFEAFITDYLDLNTNYDEMKQVLIKGEPEIMLKAIETGSGIKILRQDLWETTVDFIISQNNNIPRIKGCVENLAKIAGDAIGEFRGETRYAVPTPEKLAALKTEDLKEVRLGYRDKYLIETAKQWVTLGEEGREEERLEVGSFPGVGPKVEACIRLFGMHDMESFPIDVWVKRLMHDFYSFDENDKAGMMFFAQEKFAPYAGLAQQYLFYYVREISENSKK